MKRYTYILSVIVCLFVGCDSPKTGTKNRATKQLPYFTFHKENVFPGNGSLHRAEDGIALDDGRILVSDQATGLRLIAKDGTSRAFGKFEAVGFEKNASEQNASPNGVALERDGQHLLMADLATGKLYRINLATEAVELIYDHPYGMNAVYEDKTGAIWFTQSAESTNISELLKDINLPAPHGAVFRMSNLKSKPVKVADSLYLANGLTMDKAEKHLYVSETMMDRVQDYAVDTKNGLANYAGVAANVSSPDNLLVDQEGRLVVATTFANQVVAVDFKRHAQYVLFDGSTKENVKTTNELNKRNHLGLPRLNLHSPTQYSPLPGGLTGMFFSKDGRTLYITNLGKDLLKYDL